MGCPQLEQCHWGGSEWGTLLSTQHLLRNTDALVMQQASQSSLKMTLDSDTPAGSRGGAQQSDGGGDQHAEG